MENEKGIFILARDFLIVSPDKTSLVMHSKIADDKTIFEVAKSFTRLEASDISVETQEETEILVWTVDWRHADCNLESIPEMSPALKDRNMN